MKQLHFCILEMKNVTKDCNITFDGLRTVQFGGISFKELQVIIAKWLLTVLTLEHQKLLYRSLMCSKSL